jgi:ribosomal protein S18 acetylase RimI-like enzyme
LNIVLTWKIMDLAKLQIKAFREEEHLALVPELTKMLHEAYKPLADRGFQYSASHQPPEKTLERLKRGDPYLAFWDGQLAGTITLYEPKPESPCEYYRKEGVCHFGQFAVGPAFQGRGIGNGLIRIVEERVKQLGGKELALDTAEGAAALIGMYERRGFKAVSSTQWASTNYQSVVMSKPIILG